jgi:hypothetical protein
MLSASAYIPSIFHIFNTPFRLFFAALEFELRALCVALARQVFYHLKKRPPDILALSYFSDGVLGFLPGVSLRLSSSYLYIPRSWDYRSTSPQTACFEMEVLLTFCARWPVFPILASRVAQITGVSHHTKLTVFRF